MKWKGVNLEEECCNSEGHLTSTQGFVMLSVHLSMVAISYDKKMRGKTHYDFTHCGSWLWK